MAFFKDLDSIATPMDSSADMSEQEIRTYDYNREQVKMENLQDDINTLSTHQQSVQQVRDTGREVTGIKSDEEINELLEMKKAELNIIQAKYDYMMRTTDMPWRRQVSADVSQVLYDAVRPTDMGDVASMARVGAVLINVVAGSGATTPLLTALKMEAGVTAVETGADILRDMSEGTQITPERIFTQATSNLALNMGAYGLGKGFKVAVDKASGRATTNFMNKNIELYQVIMRQDPNLVDYQKTVFDAVDQSKGMQGYAKRVFQTEKGITLDGLDDAWRMAGVLDDVVSKQVVSTVAVEEGGTYVMKTTNAGGITEAVLKSSTENKVIAKATPDDVAKALSPDAIRHYELTNTIRIDEPLDSDSLISLAKIMESNPDATLDGVKVHLDARGTNHSMRLVNKKRLQWIEAGRYDLAKQSTADVLGAIRVDATIENYKIMSPQFRQITQMVNDGQYHKINKVINIGTDERNILEMVNLNIDALSSHIKASAHELNATIGYFGGGHKINNMLDLMEYADKEGINLVHMMYDPRYADEPWLREMMTAIHKQINTARGLDVTNIREFATNDGLVDVANRYGLGDLFENSPFVNAEGVDKMVVSTKMSKTDIWDLKNTTMATVESNSTKQLEDTLKTVIYEDTELGINFRNHMYSKKVSYSDFINMSKKNFKKFVQEAVGTGTKGQVKFTKAFNELRDAYFKETKEINDLFKQVGREYNIATNRLEQLPRYMNKQTLMGEGFDMLAEYGDGLAKDLKRVPWEEMDDLQREAFNLTIKPDMERTFKIADIQASEYAHNIAGLDSRTSTVKQLWEQKPELMGDLDKTAWYIYQEQTQKMGEILQARYGNLTDQQIFDLYKEKYGFDEIAVTYVDGPTDYNARILFSGDTATEFQISTDNFSKLTRLQQMAIIRHEIEHIIDLQKYGTSGGIRGNHPSALSNASYRRGVSKLAEGDFEFNPNMSIHMGADLEQRTLDFLARHQMTLDENTNLDVLLRQFYDDHFYNFATDTFENSYVKHTAKYLELKYQPDNIYWDFLKDMDRSTMLNGRQINMTEIMHKYFDNKTGFEDFMLTHGGGREISSKNLTDVVRTDGEVRALGMTRPQYIASFSQQNLDKLQKGGFIGDYQGSKVGRGVKVDSDMVHLYRQYTKKLDEMWLNDRLTKYAGERFTDQNMFVKVMTNMILGNGGIKQTVTAPYQMAERLMMGGKVVKGMEEMLRQTGMAVGNYGKLNVYNLANFMDSMTRMAGSGDVEAHFSIQLARKMRQFADSTNMQAEGIEDLFQLRQMMKEMYGIQAGNSPQGMWKKADEYFARSLSTQEFYDTYANYTVGKWTVDDFKDITNALKYEDLTPMQKRMMARGGYMETNWKEGQRLLQKYNHADGFNIERGMAESKELENMYITGKGFYNRTSRARNMAKVNADVKDFRYLMRTTMGLAVDSWRETMTLVDGGILTPVKVGSKEGASILAMRAGFLGLSGGGAYFSYKGIRDMERALRTRDINALNWARQLEEAERDLEWYARRGVDLLDFTGMSVYLADPRGLTAVATAKNEGLRMISKFSGDKFLEDNDNPIDDIFKVAFGFVAGSTMLSRYTMLAGSEAEKESQMADYYNSGQYNRDVRKNFNRHGISISRGFLQNYTKSTGAMKK